MTTESIANRTLVALPPAVQPRVVRALERLAGVDVVDGWDEPFLVTDGSTTPLTVVEPTADELRSLLAAPPPPPALLLIRAVLDDATAAQVEDAGFGYVDGAGRAWLPGQPTTRQRRRRVGPRALRPESLRLAQLLADHPDQPWTERSLAERAETTTVTAHRLLKRLEDEDLVERRGGGRSTERSVADVVAFRRWLAANGRPGRVSVLTCFVADPTALPAQVDGHSLVLTGAAAAERMGLPVLTSIARPTYRVAVDDDEDVEHVPQELGGFRTDAGANLALIADPARLAALDARGDAAGGLLAPPSRVMLDLYLEPRGEAAADVFLDLWGAKAL